MAPSTSISERPRQETTRLPGTGGVRESSRFRTGFTIVELTILLVVLGLLAAVAIPRFTSNKEEGKAAAVSASLAAMRNAVDSYWSQHSSFPGTKTGKQFSDQLLNTTGKDGTVGTGTGFGYGPYLRRDALPKNPFTDTNTVKVVAKMPAGPSGKQAWIFCHATGELRCNVKGHTPDGRRLFDL